VNPLSSGWGEEGEPKGEGGEEGLAGILTADHPHHYPKDQSRQKRGPIRLVSLSKFL